MAYGEAAFGTTHAVEVLILAAKNDLVHIYRDTVGELNGEVRESFVVVQLGLHSARDLG